MPSRFAALLALALAACTPRAHDVSTTFVVPPDLPAGALEVILHTPSEGLSIAINDQLVVERKHTRRAMIAGLPAGLASVRVTTGGGCETGAVHEIDVEVVPGRTARLALPGPELSTGCGVMHGLAYLGARISLAAVSAVVLAAALAPR